MSAPQGRARARDGEEGLVLACDFAARHPGNFLLSQLAVAREVRTALGLRTVFAFPARAARRSSWLPMVAEAGFGCELLPASAWRRPAALVRIARDARARIVHSHFAWFDLESLYAAERTGAAAVWHAHNGLLDYRAAQRLSDLVKGRLLARRCDAVIATSEAVGRDLLRRGFPPGRVAVIPNALVLDRFEGTLPGPAEARRRLDIGGAAFVVAAFAWPPVLKGIDVLLEAVARARQRAGRPVVLVLAGETARVADFVRAQLGTLPKWVSLIPPVDDVAELFRAADAFVSAAREEGFCYAAGEAMACGLPVLGSDIPGTAHYAAAPGFLPYPVEDAAALADRILALEEDARRRELGAANRRWVFAHLAVDRHVADIVDCYRAVLTHRGGLTPPRP